MIVTKLHRFLYQAAQRTTRAAGPAQHNSRLIRNNKNGSPFAKRQEHNKRQNKKTLRRSRRARRRSRRPAGRASEQRRLRKNAKLPTAVQRNMLHTAPTTRARAQVGARCYDKAARFEARRGNKGFARGVVNNQKTLEKEAGGEEEYFSQTGIDFISSH